MIAAGKAIKEDQMSILSRILNWFKPNRSTRMAAVDFTNLATNLAAILDDGKALLEKIANAAASEAQIAKLSSDLAAAQEDATASQAKADDYAAQLKALHDQIGAALNPAPAA